MTPPPIHLHADALAEQARRVGAAADGAEDPLAGDGLELSLGLEVPVLLTALVNWIIRDSQASFASLWKIFQDALIVPK